MKDFYIDFSEYTEEVAGVLYEEVQKHAFELGYEWCVTKKTLEKYKAGAPVIIFSGKSMSSWIDTPCSTKNKMSVEEFLKMEKEPEYRVGMPMGYAMGYAMGDDYNISVYIGEGDASDVFKAIPIKHGSKRLEYTLCDQHMYAFWKPIDPSRIKVTIK